MVERHVSERKLTYRGTDISLERSSPLGGVLLVPKLVQLVGEDSVCHFIKCQGLGMLGHERNLGRFACHDRANALVDLIPRVSCAFPCLLQGYSRISPDQYPGAGLPRRREVPRIVRPLVQLGASGLALHPLRAGPAFPSAVLRPRSLYVLSSACFLCRTLRPRAAPNVLPNNGCAITRCGVIWREARKALLGAGLVMFLIGNETV